MLVDAPRPCRSCSTLGAGNGHEDGSLQQEALASLQGQPHWLDFASRTAVQLYSQRPIW